MFRRSSLAVTFLVLASYSAATVTQVHSRAELGADDLINWSQFGPNDTLVNSGAHGLTDNGIGFTIFSYDETTHLVDTGPAWELKTMGVDWSTGPYSAGAPVMHHLYNDHRWRTGLDHHTSIIFDQKVAGVGVFASVNFSANTPFDAYAYAHGYGGIADATIANYDHQLHILPVPYLGILSDAANLDFTYKTDLLATADDHGSVIGNVDIRDAAPAPVPEPASMMALGMAVGVLIRSRKNKR